MEVQFSPSVNIIRDSRRKLRYLITPNATRVATKISDDFNRGFHSFNLIGSYGTGKSAFLWALGQTLERKSRHFNIRLNPDKVKVLHVVGEFAPITKVFADQLGLRGKTPDFQDVLDELHQQYEKVGLKKGLLVIMIDELGKFFEYAVKHEPEKELYFIQQLAEFANASDRNILLITALHQSFEAYGQGLPEAQRKEWMKVKGRLRELPFNEPVEQLLMLTREHFRTLGKRTRPNIPDLLRLRSVNEQSRVFPIEKKSFDIIARDLIPIDTFAAYVLTLALQQYGQNERSLFTFLHSADEFGINGWTPTQSRCYNLANVYDYLNYNFHSYLNTKFNPHFNQWSSIRTALDRCESLIKSESTAASQLVKAVGLLNIFAAKGARLDHEFLCQYASLCLGFEHTQELIQTLVEKQIIRFSRYDQSFKLWQGTDLDIEEALIKVAEKVDPVVDVGAALDKHFQFPYITAKAASYHTGTPRNFQFVVSEKPIAQLPVGEVDGFINLIFNAKLAQKELIDVSARQEEAIIYGYFKSAEDIKVLLLDVEKTERVIAEHQDDHVAVKELKSIREHQKTLLTHYVLGSLYSKEVAWFYNGERRHIKTQKEFNRLLSEACKTVYPKNPVYKNELVNRHKIQGSISTARKNFFEAMVNNWKNADFGFLGHQFPPEKTIYRTLLRKTGMHSERNGTWELCEPTLDKSFVPLWKACDKFLSDSKSGRKKVTELIDVLSKRPFKMKQGLIDFWVPTYLFIKRGDFALFENDFFVPHLNDVKLYEITRNPQHYEIKAFEITGIRLKLFNKYREFLKQEQKVHFTNSDFIDSVRPFLVFYKGLPDYCKKTQRLSVEAKSLRAAIVNAQDPERVFFEDFPSAFRLTEKELAGSEEMLADFARMLNDAIGEIKSSFEELLNRLEVFIQEDVIGAAVDFAKYRELFRTRFTNLKQHRLLPAQKVFLQRVLSPIDDRNSWIASLAQSLLQKPLDQISDDEEEILKDRLLITVKELDNLREIQQQSKSGNVMYKFDLTTMESGTRSMMVDIPKSKSKEVDALAAEIKTKLKSRKSLTAAVLAKLLNEEFKP